MLGETTLQERRFSKTKTRRIDRPPGAQRNKDLQAGWGNPLLRSLGICRMGDATGSCSSYSPLEIDLTGQVQKCRMNHRARALEERSDLIHIARAV